MPFDLHAVLETNQAGFAQVVPFDHRADKLKSLDFTVANTELTDTILSDIVLFCAYINGKLESGKARYGIGGYGELRKVYSKSRVFDSQVPGEEPRRFHIGTDIWGKPHTAVMAPLDGIVHSFAFNNRPGDYGATIILTHRLQEHTFYTLYGHLSLNSIKNIQPGDRISRGDIFADFGIPAENGHWPPHLHFQVIGDMGEWNGDYPGVCKYSEREQYLAGCPDPDLVLRMNRFCFSFPAHFHVRRFL